MVFLIYRNYLNMIKKTLFTIIFLASLLLLTQITKAETIQFITYTSGRIKKSLKNQTNFSADHDDTYSKIKSLLDSLEE